MMGGGGEEKKIAFPKTGNSRFENTISSHRIKISHLFKSGRLKAFNEHSDPLKSVKTSERTRD